MKFLDIFDQSALSDRLFAILDGKARKVASRLYEINKRPIICDIVPWHEDDWKGRGAFLVIRDAEHLDQLLEDRNEIIRQIEGKEYAAAVSTPDIPEGAFEGFAGRGK